MLFRLPNHSPMMHRIKASRVRGAAKSVLNRQTILNFTDSSNFAPYQYCWIRKTPLLWPWCTQLSFICHSDWDPILSDQKVVLHAGSSRWDISQPHQHGLVPYLLNIEINTLLLTHITFQQWKRVQTFHKASKLECLMLFRTHNQYNLYYHLFPQKKKFKHPN